MEVAFNEIISWFWMLEVASGRILKIDKVLVF